MTSWEHPFLETHPFVRPSLNRARIIDLPGIDLPPGIQGKHGYELLGAQQLREKVTQTFPWLQNNTNPLLTFATFFEDSHAQREAATAVAIEYGRALGYLLLMLHRGDGINREARPDWGEAHWGHWRQVRQVWVGGGLLAGHMGTICLWVGITILHKKRPRPLLPA